MLLPFFLSEKLNETSKNSWNIPKVKMQTAGNYTYVWSRKLASSCSVFSARRELCWVTQESGGETHRPSDWLADWPAGPLSSSAHWCLRHDRSCHLVLGRRGLIGSSRSRDERLSAAVNLTYPPLLSASPVSTSRPWQLALLSASSEGNSGLKASCPSPSFLLSPEEVGGMAGISQHPRGAPTSWLPPPRVLLRSNPGCYLSLFFH